MPVETSQETVTNHAHPTVLTGEEQETKMDRRSKRSRALLRDALSQEIEETGIENITVSALAERADLNRRTFYTHFKDIPDFISQCQQEILDELAEVLNDIKLSTLDEMYAALKRGEGWPGAEVIFTFMKDNYEFMSAMLGPNGDPAFQLKLSEVVVSQFYDRLMSGIDDVVQKTMFDYYVEYSVSAQLGILILWLQRGAKESPRYMARLATALQFVRPGDLYGRPLENEPFSFLELFAGLVDEAYEQ